MDSIQVKTDDSDSSTVKPTNFQKKGICVTIDRNKGTSRIESDSPDEFMRIIKKSEVSWINFVVGDVSIDGEGIATSLGFSPGIVTTLLSSYQYNYEDRDSELGIRIPAVSTEQLDVKVYPLIILIRRGLILSIHESAITRLVHFSRYAETFMKKISSRKLWQDKMTLLLWRIVEENNAKNFDHLRSIEEQADHLVKELMDPATPRELLGPHIYKMKHALIVYLDALWATLDVINTLRYGDAETVTDSPELLNRISALYTDVTNQISLSEHMSEVLASGLEVLQSIYNNQLQILNNKLALVVTWLTVAGTAVLVPNTLATMFGVSAIGEHMDEFSILAILLAATVLSAVASYWFIRHKRFVPQQVH